MKKLLFSFVLLAVVLFGLFTFSTIYHALETNMLKPMSTNVKNFKEVAVKKIIDFDGEEGYEVSYKLFSERYGKQNIAYARVHLDERTPHLHLGVVPMRDGRLQGKNVFNRKELQWLQDSFPKHMQSLGFEVKRGEKGSDREHIEMTRFNGFPKEVSHPQGV